MAYSHTDKKRMAYSPRSVLERNANGIAKIIEGEIIPIANDMKDCLGPMDYSRIVSTPALPPLERANTLVQRVITQVEVEPEQFHTFTNVLKKHGKLSPVRRLVDPDGLIVAGDQSLVPLKKVSVKANMTGYLVGIQSTLQYSNDSEEPLEVIFKFPVEESFAVVGLEAVVGGKKIKAQIREKEEAKQAYDEAKVRGFTAALAEEKTGDIFSISLGNLPPKSEAEIYLKLAGELPIDTEGAIRFTLPAVLKQKYTPAGSTDPLTQVSGLPGQVVHDSAPAVHDFALTVAETEIISDITSPTHNITAQEKSGLMHVSLQDATPLNEDLVVLVKFHDPHQPKVIAEPGDSRLSWSTYMSSPAVMLNYFPKFETKEATCEFMFLIDRSGSMRGSTIASARETLILFLKSLPPGCRFNIMGFGSRFTSLFPNSVSYNQQHVDEAITHAQSIQADLGGTELLRPLEHIFKQPLLPGYLRQLFLLTDGAVSNTSQCIHEVKKNAKYARVFTFGIGSGVSTELVRGIARAGNGRAEFVYKGERIQPKVISSLKRALQPVVSDLSIKFDVPSCFKVYQAPEEVPTLFSGDKVVVYGIMKKRKSASDQSFRPSLNGTATLTGQILSKPVEFKITFEIPPPSDFRSSIKLPIIHHLASKSLICDLQSGDDWTDAATTRKQKDRIVNLSIESGVVSSHTAYIALDEGQDKLMEGAVKTWDVVATMAHYKERISPPGQSTPHSMPSIQRPLCTSYGSRMCSTSSYEDIAESSCAEPQCMSFDNVCSPKKDLRVDPFLSAHRTTSYCFSKSITLDSKDSMSHSTASMSYSIPNGQYSEELIPHSSMPYFRSDSRQSMSNSRQSMSYPSKAQGIYWPTEESTALHLPQRRKILLGKTDNLELIGEAESTAQKSTTRPKTELEFLISLQKIEGFWGLDVFQLFDFLMPLIKDNIKEIYATVYALAYMEIKFPSQRDEWELVARKGEAWLERQTLPDQVNLEELKKEASDYIITNLVE